ncbi:ribosome maturation factor RimM [Salibaculum sp.]|uniref:ribosome maturation factor RimM n=1 Tax=Salibaculum sp. TaxID=2855480 RepID=UPI002B49F634|nr:ribosome maturation factor RimM [Salibaculum sp.]HKL70159.1 ribosome maturation factor RimM [Salibaculum sp.]
MSDETITLGSIAGAFGVKGEVRLKSFCAEPEAIIDYTPLTRSDGKVVQTIVLTGRAKGALVVRMDGITTKEEADALRGVELHALRSQLPALPDDEFYHADLVGLAAVDTGGESLGRVKSVQSNGADDLLEVQAAGLRDTVLVPFTRSIVPTVDLAAGRLVIDPPGGLFED